MQEKIRTVDEIGSVVAAEKKSGKRVVHCHGVFDLLHPGHIRHFFEAKAQGDTLIVSLTPDRFVNKGPGRPTFNESLRCEQLAALACVDFVVLNDSPDAVSIIERVCPDLYVKGAEYRRHGDDVTGKISEEADAIKKVGGKIYYTDDVVFSSSNLINRFFDADANRIAPFIEAFKERFSLKEVIGAIDSFENMKVLIVGDAILDEYQYVSPLGQSGKGHQFTAALRESELFLGGSLVIANHVADFVGHVDLMTAIGKDCPYRQTIEKGLLKNVTPHFFESKEPTLLKKRYVQKDGKSLTKLFETYSTIRPFLDEQQTKEVAAFLQRNDYDLVIAADFGNGFTNPGVIAALCSMSNFLAVNTQTNSGNRGFNVITNYQRADYVSLNEPELRLAAHDRDSRIEKVIEDICHVLRTQMMSVTRGSEGVFFHSDGEDVEIPALTMQAIDRVGAGDSYLALSSLAAAKGFSPWISGFLGSVAAAIGVQIIGNKEAINKVGLCKYITRLMK